MRLIEFEKVSKYMGDDNIHLPIRKTKYSAGYDFEVAKDTIVPSYTKLFRELNDVYPSNRVLLLEEMSKLTKETGARPTLVPTGIKCKMSPNMYLELSVRSSCPLKTWLVLANGVGIIDADYYNNADNEGEIFFQMINLSPNDIILYKGDCVGQGILKQYYTVDDDVSYDSIIRSGGFGSTDKK